jgi:hypothetical protein
MYFLFAGDIYYPTGGMQDYVGTVPTLEAAREAVTNPPKDEDGWNVYQTEWYNIAQVVDGQLVEVEKG